MQVHQPQHQPQRSLGVFPHKPTRPLPAAKPQGQPVPTTRAPPAPQRVCSLREIILPSHAPRVARNVLHSKFSPLTFETPDDETMPAPDLWRALEDYTESWGERLPIAAGYSLTQLIEHLKKTRGRAKEFRLVLTWPGCPEMIRAVRLTPIGTDFDCDLHPDPTKRKLVGPAGLYRNIAQVYESYFRELQFQESAGSFTRRLAMPLPQHLKRIRLLKLWHLGDDLFQAELEFFHL